MTKTLRHHYSSAFGRTRLIMALRRRTERGAALVEAAIVFIPLAFILFGIIEYGFIFKDSLTLSSATRAGARTASAEPGASTFFTDTVAAVDRASTAAQFKTNDFLLIYKVLPTNTTGEPTAGQCPGSSCNRYSWKTTVNAATKTKWHPDGGTWDPEDVESCLGPTMDSVGIKLRLSHDAITGFFTGLPLTEKTVMRLEPTC